MQLLRAKRYLPLLLLALIGLLSACGQQVVTPVDTAAYALNAKITVSDITQGTSALVAIQLSEKTDNSKILQFDSQESLTLNGKALQWNSKYKDYEIEIGRQSPGGSYSIVYTDHGHASNLSISVPQLASFTSPAKDATVSHNSRLTVTFQAPGASQVEIDASDDAGHFIQGEFKQSTGTYSDIDVSTLNQGPGTLRLVANYKTNPTTDFSSTEIDYQMITGLTVIWS